MAPDKKEIIAPLTGVKFLLCLLVIVSNMVLYGDVDPGFVYFLKQWEIYNYLTVTFRVDVFFMITGFLLMHLYADRFEKGISVSAIKDFLVVRLARIYPLYALSLLVILGLYFSGIWQFTKLDEGGGGSPERVVMAWGWFYNFTLTSAWGFTDIKSAWNGPAWSISAEFFNYLMFPFYLCVISRLKSFSIQLISIVFVCAVYGVLQYLFIADYIVDYGYGALIRANFGLLSGALVYGLYQHLKQTKSALWDIVFLAAIGLIVGLIMLELHGVLQVPKIAYMALLILLTLGLSLMKGWVHDFFAHPIMMHLGKLSFAMYLFHQPVARVMGYYLHDTYKQVPYLDLEVILVHLAVVLFVIILVSHIAYSFVETPLRYKLRRLMGVKKVQVKV